MTYSSRPNPLAHAAGALIGLALIYYVLYSSHLARVLIWGTMLLATCSQAAIAFASPGQSGTDKAVIGVVTALVFAFLLILGWLGRTPEGSLKIFYVVAGVQVALFLIGFGVGVLSKI
jgi:hypothetical protein